MEGFPFFLEETDGIRQGNVLYRSLKKIKEDLDTGQMQVGEETRSLLLGLEESLCPIIEQLSADRLSLALSLSEQVFQNKMPLKKAQSKLLRPQIRKFNLQLNTALQSFQKMGVNLSDLTEHS